MADVVLVSRDPLASPEPLPWPHAEAPSLSVWAPIPLGVDEDGQAVTVLLPERNVLIGGEPGAGKSVGLSMLVATYARCAPRWTRATAACSPRAAQGLAGLPLQMVVCDELAFYLKLPDRKQRTEFAELMRDLVARGRAAGIVVVAATQKPSADVIPTALRDLFGFRWPCAAPRRRPRTRSSDRAGPRRASTRRRSPAGREASATCSPRGRSPSA